MFPTLSSHAPSSSCLTHRRHRGGYTLFESLLCIAIVGLAAVPLAGLSTGWLRWSGEHERLVATLRLAAEQAEVGDDAWPIVGGDASRVALCETASPGGGCLPGSRLAVAMLPAEATSRVAQDTVMPTRIALWVSP
ncbi:type II secretion system protein [Cupriavidus sp. SW-Y-13]|uniref:type II secretion system protein n=1 Tax=Cupriavidus sp. SW-Y-13 TaxID=2653854 RepID=UPI0013651988|nr:type II secretion system protein [Cupriavidus sp. SW-Y-13]MWL88158.1 hypothetical protein [Cupriavidus sp. SW-Y-13]